MKILLSCVPFDGGKSGISVYLKHLAAALAEQKQNVTLIVEADAAVFFPEYQKIELPRYCRNALLSMLYQKIRHDDPVCGQPACALPVSDLHRGCRP